MIIIGLLTAAVNGLAQYSVHQQIAQIERRGGMADPDQVQKVTIINLGFVAMGVLFVVMGIIIHQFPVPITITALVLYVIATLIAFALNEELLKNMFAVGIRVAIIAGFWKAVQSAQAYEKERRMAPYGEF